MDFRQILRTKRRTRRDLRRKERKLAVENLERRELLTTFYVDGANGNNSNDGLSLGGAFETIQAAANAAFPGDEVLIRAGTYREQVNVPRSGSSTSPITFSAYNGESVVISGGDLVTGWTQHSGDIWVATANWNANNDRDANTLFVDGEYKYEGRQFGENDLLDIDDWGELKQGRLSSNSNSFTVDDLSGFANDFWNGAKIRFHTHDYIVTTKTITDYNASTGRITFDNPVGTVSQKQTNGYYIYDALQTVDKPGEWYKADGGNQLYYHAEAGQNPNSLEIEFRRRGYAFDVSSRDYIHIKDMEFRGVSIDTDSNTDYNTYENIKFYAYNKDDFGRFNITGDYNVLRDSELSHTWNSAVVVGGLRNEIVNNYMHDIGYGATTRVLSATGAEELLVSHNTVSTFARSFMDGYPLRSEIAYNIFEDGGNLTWDTGVFDSDGGNGNSSYSIFHHNVFRDTAARGIFESFYGLNNNAVVHHNVFHDFTNTTITRPIFRSSGLDFRQSHHNTFISEFNRAPSGSLDAIDAIQSRYNNNIQITREKMEALGIEVRGNHDYTPSDFVDFNGRDFQLAPGSGAIDAGIVLPGINDDYLGAAPDAGAFESGRAPWVAGHNFVNEPNPVFDWKSLPGSNIYENGTFLQGISDWTVLSGSPNSSDRNSWNLGPSGTSLTGTFRTQSIELTPESGIRRTFTGLTPNTTYTVGATVRVANRITEASQYSESSGSITSGTHRDESYVTGISSGEWVRYGSIDFGDLGQYDHLDLLHIRDPADGFTKPIEGLTIQVRLDSPTGQLLAEFSDLTDGQTSDRWRADREAISNVAGTHSIYVSTTGGNGANIAIGSFRLLKEPPSTTDLVTVSATSTGAKTATAQIGSGDWQRGYDQLTFSTGPSATTADIKFQNHGRINAYVDRMYLVEGHVTRGGEPTEVGSNGVAELSLDATTSGSADGVLDGNLSNQVLTGDHENSWIQVDLQSTKRIHGIVLSPPTTNFDRASNFRVSVWSDAPSNGGIELWNQDYLTDGRSLNANESLNLLPSELGRDGHTELGDINGRFIRVQLLGENNHGDNRLALGEIQVYGFDVTNLAVSDGIATQSSTATGQDADAALDGDSTTYSATQAGTTNSWWQVRFTQPFSIGEIELVNRDDASFEELSNFTVSVWDEDPSSGGVKLWEKSYFSSGSVGQGESLVINGGEVGADGFTRLATAHRGRVVRVQLNGSNNAGNGTLALAEVRVASGDKTDPASNVALSGIATHRNDFYGDTAGGGFATDANDGVILPRSNFTSAANEFEAWWQVDLQRTTQIDQIVLFNRQDAASRLNNFRVSVWDDDPENGGSELWGRNYGYSNSAPFYSTSSITAGGALLVNGNVTSGGTRLDQVTNGRFVRVQLNGSNILSLAEVQVWSDDAPQGEGTLVDLNATSYDYDFGTALSPVEAGNTRISPLTSGDISWSNSVAARDAGVTSGVTASQQDVVASSLRRSLHHKIANGVWQITLNMGEVGLAHDNMRVFAEGFLLDASNADDVDSDFDEFIEVVGLVQVRDGVLDLEFESLGGVDTDWVVNSLSLDRVGDSNFELVNVSQTQYDYDLGEVDSPVAAGFVRLSDLTNGDINWSGSVQSLDRSGDDLNRDFVYSNAARSLEHKLASGVWDVTLNLGDAASARDDISITAEGVLQNGDIDTAAGEFLETTFRVEVTDGGLSLELNDNGGTNNEWVLNRLSIARVSDVPLTAGDFNADQAVDQADYVLWQSSYGVSGSADGDYDRDSDGADFLAWQRSLGFGVTSTTSLLDATNGNGSFEDQAGATGGTVAPPYRVFSSSGTATIPGWTVQTTGIAGWDGLLTDAASNGAAYAFAIGNGLGTYTSDEVAGHTTAENDQFTLTFDVGNAGGTHGYEARLRFGPNTRVLGSFTDTTNISGGTLASMSFEYTATAADAGFSPIIEIVMDNNSGVSQSFFDNVELDVTTTFLPSQSVASVKSEPVTSADLHHTVLPLVPSALTVESSVPEFNTLTLPSSLPEQFSTSVEFAGETLTLNLDKSSIFGENTRFLVDYGDGELVQIDHGVDRSYLGTVAEYPQYAVSAILTSEGLRANIIRPNQPSVIVEPAPFAALGGDGIAHQVMMDEAGPTTEDHDHDGDGIQDHSAEDHTDETGGGHPPGCTCAACCDTTGDLPAAIATLPPNRTIDVREYEVGVEIGSAALNNNYSGSTVQDKVNSAMSVAQNIPGNLDARFLRAAGIKHRLGTVIIRTTSDPFTVANGNDNAGLSAFRNYWNSNPGEVGNTHDLAVYHVRASPSGLAYVNSVGTSNRYALSASNGPTSWADGTLAHEFGHSWSLGHVPGGTNSSASFYESRPRNSGNSAGGDDRFISIMHGSGTHNIGRLSTGEANQVLGVKNNKLAFGDVVSPGPVAPFGWADSAVAFGDPITIDVIANDHDANNDVLDVQLRDTVSFLGGSISISDDTGPGGRNEIIYTPPAGVNGTDFFHYNVVDSTGRSDWGAVYVTNQGPVVIDPSDISFNYDPGPATEISLFPGSTLLSPETTGDVSWTSSSALIAENRGSLGNQNEYNRDFVGGTTPATLNHLVGNGTWKVVINMSDPANALDNQYVRAEGQTFLSDIDSPGGTTPGTTMSFEVFVGDGEINIEFGDADVVNPNWAVNRVVLTKVADGPAIVDTNQTTFSYDFGLFDSPVQAGWTKITPETFGQISWSSPVEARDRDDSGANDVNRDFVLSSNSSTFNHVVADGIWNVVLNMGDADNLHDLMGVRAEGELITSSINSPAGQYSYVSESGGSASPTSFNVVVLDGELNIEFFDNGGSDANWVLNRMSLTRVGDVPDPIAPGDFDKNQVIDNSDLSEWLAAYGNNTEADGDDDGDSDGSDFLQWQRNYGVGVQTTTNLLNTSSGNGSFENQAGATGDTIAPPTRVFSNSGTATIPGWTVQTSGIAGWDGLFGDASSHGSAYAFAIGNGIGTYTSDAVTSHTTVENDEFTLTFDVGSNGGTHSYEARLIFGGTTRVLGAIEDSTNIAGGSLATQTFSYTATSADAGFSPVIEIVMDNNSGISQSFFDNVRLDITTTVLPSSSLAASSSPDESPSEADRVTISQPAFPEEIETPEQLNGLQLTASQLASLTESVAADQEVEASTDQQAFDFAYLEYATLGDDDFTLLAEELASDNGFAQDEHPEEEADDLFAPWLGL